MTARLTREVVSPPRSLTRPTLLSLSCCAILLLASQQCAREVRTKLDAVVRIHDGGTMAPRSEQ